MEKHSREFVDWLLEEMHSRNMNMSGFAAAAGMSHSTVSLVMSGKNQPGFDFFNGASLALGIRPEIIMIKAGKIPPMDTSQYEELSLGQDEQLLLDHYRNLTEADKNRALVIVRALRRAGVRDKRASEPDDT